MQAAGVPKGSFYYYFGSKEDFGLQVLNRFAETSDGRTSTAILGDTSLGPLERLRRLGEATCERLESQQCRNGCLVGNLSQEMADQSEAFRARLEEIFRGWSERYADCLREAQEAGEIRGRPRRRELAEFWLNSWQGAVLRAKTIRSTVPLRTFLNHDVRIRAQELRDGVPVCDAATESNHRSRSGPESTQGDRPKIRAER